MSLAIAALVIAICAPGTWRVREPSYQGKPLSYWITPFLDTNGPYGRPSVQQFTIATNALHHIGTNAIPILVEWVSYDAQGRRNQFYRLLPKPLSHIKLLEHLYVNRNNELRAVQAGAALISLGPQASPAFPQLGHILTDADPFGAGTTALWILREIGEPAVPTLAHAMTNKPSRMRMVIAMNLGHMGPSALEAIPALKSLLQDPQPGLSSMCTHAIEEITGRPFTNITPTQAAP